MKRHLAAPALLVLAFMVLSACAATSRSTYAPAVRSAPLSEQEQNTAKGAGAGCLLVGGLGAAIGGLGFGVGALPLGGLGCAVGAIAGAVLGASHPVRTYYGTFIVSPPVQPERHSLLAFLYSGDAALRTELARELAHRGWQVAETWGRPPNSTLFAAERLPTGVRLEVYTWGGEYAVATAASVGQVVTEVLR